MILSPREYSGSSIPDLLSAAAKGHVGLDHRFFRAILDRGPSVVPELLKFGLADQSLQLVDLEEELISIFRHLRAPEALPYFVELVRRQPEDIPDDVVHALIEIGDAAAVPLLTARACPWHARPTAPRCPSLTTPARCRGGGAIRLPLAKTAACRRGQG